jgi:hypothetical protein
MQWSRSLPILGFHIGVVLEKDLCEFDVSPG